MKEKCGFTDIGERRKCPSLLVGADKEIRVLKLNLQQRESDRCLSSSRDELKEFIHLGFAAGVDCVHLVAHCAA